MNGGRRSVDSPAGPTGSPGLTGRPRANRLSRSRRQTQAEEESPRRQQSDFKTPTRVLRSRPAAAFTAESPQTDGDLQQDIIWDATSPRGKRGKKQTAGVVDISEIASRIAPEHGRPTVAEPTLQQWIADSAAIPCTPDVHPPKPKKKSPRTNAVEDLLKLAQQFDFNLFHQVEEEEEENQNQQNLQLLSGNILVFDCRESSASLPGSCRPAESAVARTDVQLHLDQHLEDDLDLLFDGPTQHVSRNLSQASQVRTVLPSSRDPAEFEDDWGNDDLLDDFLLLEMTQNPQNFAAPKHCSTQKPNQVTPAAAGATSQSAGSRGKENLRPRTTFRLESHPGFLVGGIPADSGTKQQNSETAGRDSRCSGESESQLICESYWWNASKPEPQNLQNTQNPQNHQRVSAGSSKSAAASATTLRKPDSSHSESPDSLDLELNLDLDSLFSSDPLWDDPADDDLLCEMCEHLENQIHSLDNVLPNQRAALQLSSRTFENLIQPPQKHSAGSGGRAGGSLAAGGRAGGSLAAGGRAGGSLAAGGRAGGSLVAGGHAGGSLVAGGHAGGSLAADGRAGGSLADAGHVSGSAESQHRVIKANFTFKRPNNPVSMTTNHKAKCSAAEIELKKQQAMERRRQRLQAQNLGEPT